MSSKRPQRKATKRLYSNDGAPVELDVEMSAGETTRRGGKGVNKGKDTAKTTKWKSKRAPAVASDEEEQDELDSSSEVEQPTMKRKKASKKQRKNTKQQQGKLELINTLPVELFAEICSYLTPGDLLALSLSSKAFRSSLISPGSLSLWKAARLSVGLPELTSGDITNSQYAHLVYGSRCDMCQRGNAQSVDFFLRKRLCSACRKQNWIKVDASLSKLNPKIHRRAAEASLTTSYAPSQTRWSTSQTYAFLPDLEAISSKLWDLEEEDAIDLEYKSLGYSLLSGSKASGSSSTRSRRSRTSLPPTDDSDKEDASDSGYGGEDDQQGETRVETFIDQRQALKKSAAMDAKLLTPAYQQLKTVRTAEKQASKRADEGAGWSRRRAIEAKVLALNQGYTRNDFSGLWLTSKITCAAEALTDEVWDEIKPKVIKLLARVKKEREQSVALRKQSDRKGALRPRYEKLRTSQPDEAVRASLPLFADFLQLDSVKPFWEPEDAVAAADDAWDENLDGLLEELDDYRLTLRLHAVKTILAATTRIAEEELTGDADDFGPEQYDDDFLERPTSFLVCSLTNCYRKRSWSYREGRFRSIPERLTFFGSLPDLLKHQHECHPNVTFSDKQLSQRAQDGIVGHFALPPAVVSALSAVIEVGELGDETATVAELDSVTKPWSSLSGSYDVKRDTFSWLVYENAPVRKGRRYANWRELIDGVFKHNQKAVKSKRPLEVPTIALRGRKVDREERQKERKTRARARKRPSHPWDYSDDE